MPETNGRSKTKLIQPDKKLPAAMTPDQAHQMLGGAEVVSRATFYVGIKKGQIPALRVGKRIIIPREAYLKWLEAGGLGA
jgi:excisionase family DNA binding protein